MLELRSKHVLINGIFQPACVRVNYGVIVEILDYNIKHDDEWNRIDFGSHCLGPGLVDVAPQSTCIEALHGGVTTICLASPVMCNESSPVNLHFCGGSVASLLPFTLVASPASDEPPLHMKPLVFIQADHTTLLASPFRNRPVQSRIDEPGNAWKTGRTRKGSASEESEEGDGDICLPQDMLNVIFERERRGFMAATTVITTASIGSRFRPPPITPVRVADSFSPKEFLRYYRVYLSLRPVQIEIDGVLLANKQENCRAILRVSSAQALHLVSPRILAGTTIAHLFFNADDVEDGATWLKLDPPIRESADQQALLRRALDPLDETFCISSGHYDHLERDFDNFERTISNGPTMSQWLSAVWTYAHEKTSSSMLSFATLWQKCTRLPSRVACLERSKGRIAVGMDADLVVFDTQAEARVVLKPSVFQTRTLVGNVAVVIIAGHIRYEAGG